MSGHPEVAGEYPAADLAEEILTPGAGQVRSLVTVGGNPMLSTPNSNQLADAFADLEFMVSIDIYLNETTKYADVVLPVRHSSSVRTTTCCCSSSWYATSPTSPTRCSRSTRACPTSGR